MTKYEYKNSGIEWIGEVPKHWKVRRLGFFGRFFKGGGISRAQLTKIGVGAILYGDIYTKYTIKAVKIINRISEKTALNSIKLEYGDLLFTGSGETKEDIGKCIVFLAEEDTYAGGDVIIFKQKTLDSLFLSYSMSSNASIFQKSRTAKGEIIVHTYGSKLKYLQFPVPKKTEQTAIAAYLDKACADIDRVVEIKRQQIENLKQQLKSIIHHTVTKGLNKNAELKDSGIEWIGEVPKHWKVVKVKYEIDVKDGTHDTPNYEVNETDNYPFITSKDISKNEILFNSCKYINRKYFEDYDRRSNVRKNDIIMPMIGTIGNSAIVTTNRKFAIKNVALYKTSSSLKIHSKYLFYFIESEINKTQMDLLSKGGVQSFVSLTVLRNSYMIKPPQHEQQEIASYLDTISEKLSSAQSNIEKQIDTLLLYKKSLIHEVVTGKKQVYFGEN